MIYYDLFVVGASAERIEAEYQDVIATKGHCGGEWEIYFGRRKGTFNVKSTNTTIAPVSVFKLTITKKMKIISC